MRRTVLLLLAWFAHPALAWDYVGANACKACHPAAYAVWRAGPHARAGQNLPEPRRQDPRCTACHAPSAELSSGVSCESCHGPGRSYAHAYVMRDCELARAVGLSEVGEKTCAVCHTESSPSLERFDYPRKSKLIDHWTSERAARQGAAR